MTTETKTWVPSIPAVTLEPEKTTDLLSRVRLANDQVYSDLQSFVCSEQIQRFKGPLTGGHERAIDRVSAKVSFENGSEHYTEILQNERPRTNISRIGGAWSEGEFGTLLQQTQILLKTQPVAFRAYTNRDGAPAAIFNFEVSDQESPWALNIAGRDYRVGFRTEIWVSRATGQILKISRTSTSIPSGMGISELRWGVELKAVDLNGRTWLLPKRGEYEVRYEGKGHREWNTLSFSEYRRYGSEATLRFDTVAQPTAPRD